VKGNIKELRKQTLKEVPKQVMAYMREHKVSPEILSHLTNEKMEDDKDSYFNELKGNMANELLKDGYNDEQIKLVLDGGIYEYSKEQAIKKINENNQHNYASLPEQKNSMEMGIKNLQFDPSNTGKHAEKQKIEKIFEEKKEIYI